MVRQFRHETSVSFVFGLLFPLLLTSGVMGARAIPDDNLSYPVRIRIDNRDVGSGFYLNTKAASFLVTARHVLFDEAGKLRGKEATLLSYARDSKDKTRNTFRLDLPAFQTSGELKTDIDHDVAVIRIGKSSEQDSLKIIEGVVIIEKAITGLLGVGWENAIRFEQVLVGNDIFIFGYPSSIGLKDAPQIDYERPLLRKGIVAGLNEKTKAIILDCPAYGGNSGGPVLQVEETRLGRTEFRLIGIVMQFVPYEEKWINISQRYGYSTTSNSGYSVVEPVDRILDLISSWQP